MRVKMTIEVEIEDTMIGDDEEGKMWMEDEIFVGDGSLLLHSNEIGDTIGEVKRVTNVQWVKEKAKTQNK